MPGIARLPIARRQIGNASVVRGPDFGDLGVLMQYSPGSYTFRPTKAGFWRFVAWGAGGDASPGTGTGGGGGGLSIKTVFLTPAQTVSIVVGDWISNNGASSTVITFPDGSAMTIAPAGPGGTSAGGVATGGDVNVNGASTATSAGGAAASFGEFRGGNGGAANAPGRAPGGGAGVSSGTDPRTAGAGLVLVFFVKD